ncbi:NAD(P)/FAD-dependent oxidoreductase [Rhodococcus sp. NPDC056960]|uniref:NAD(P)/FAD-dependent oxidoreductase n=1 Tax=Rhodococcus sp. NPDC056960 TaxID=3345982 RepID=UPI00362C320D
MSLRDIVVVGGSIAAVTAIETLRIEGFEGTITMLSDEHVPPYTRVPLSKGVLDGSMPFNEAVLAPLSDDIDVRLNTRALALDTDTKVVSTATGAVPYDGLIIATGGRARRLGRADQDERVLRSHADCTRIRHELESASSVLVVGGGFLGMEVASTCHDLGKAVTVVDLAPPLERLLGPDVAKYVRTTAMSMGVTMVVADGGVRLIGAPKPAGVELVDGRRLEADLVITAIGDCANVEWLAGSGVAVHGGVVVDERCRVRENIVAAGDVAVMTTATGEFIKTPSWSNAVDQARTAARALLHGTNTPAYRASDYFWTEQFGLDIKMVGEQGPRSHYAVLEGNLSDGRALMSWQRTDRHRTLLAVNHRIPPAKLKKLYHSPIPALSSLP